MKEVDWIKVGRKMVVIVMKKVMYVLELFCNEKVINYDVRSFSW